MSDLALFTPASVQRGEATFALSRALRELRAAGDQLAGLQGDGYPAALEEIRRLADGVYAASRRLQRLPLPTGIGSTSTSR